MFRKALSSIKQGVQSLQLNGPQFTFIETVETPPPCQNSFLPHTIASEGPKSGSGLHKQLVFEETDHIMSMLDEVKEEIRNLDLELPKLMVAGQESSGKSSLLERIAMLEFFPRDEIFTTRMPIVVKLRHMSLPDLEEFCNQHTLLYDPQHGYARMRYEGKDGRVEQSPFYQLEQVEPNVRKYMEIAVKVRNGDTRGIVEDKLYIDLHSNLIPNLELVDLPGIVSAKITGEPKDMMDKSRRLVEKYIQEPHAVVLAVVPAFEHVRNSQAFQLIQKHSLESRTIGVLTMADRARDESLMDPYAKLKQKLDGTSLDCPSLPLGYVAVVNRDNRQGTVQAATSLHDAAESESDWFECNLPGYKEQGKATSTALLAKLSTVWGEYVRSTWAPDARAKIEREIDKLLEAREKLGIDPAAYEAGVVVEMVLRGMGEVFVRHVQALEVKHRVERELGYDFDTWVFSRTEMEGQERVDAFEASVCAQGTQVISECVRALRPMLDNVLDAGPFPVLSGRFKRLHVALLEHFDTYWEDERRRASEDYVERVTSACATLRLDSHAKVMQSVRYGCVRAIHSVAHRTLQAWSDLPALARSLRTANPSVDLVEEDTGPQRRALDASIERLRRAVGVLDGTKEKEERIAAS